MSHGLSRWRIEAQLKAILPTPLRTMECLGFPGAKTPDIYLSCSSGQHRAGVFSLPPSGLAWADANRRGWETAQL